MTYPLENYFGLKRTYRHGQKTFYSPKHFGVDIIVPVGTPVVAWDDVKVINRLVGSQGGMTLWVEWNGYIFRFLHLSEHGRIGSYKKGQLLGKTGNTGKSSAPHVHVDAWGKKGVTLKFEDCLDPDVIFKREETMEKVFVEAIESLVGKKYGDNLNEKEQKDAAGKLKDVKEKLAWCEQLELTNKRLLENNGELSVKLTESSKRIDEAEAIIKECSNNDEEYEKKLDTCQENLRIQSEKADEGIKVYGALELLVQAIKKMWS